MTRAAQNLQWFPDLKGDYFACSLYSPEPWAMGALAMELFQLEVIYQVDGRSCGGGIERLRAQVGRSRETGGSSLILAGFKLEV